MAGNIVVEKLGGIPIEDQEVEFVERKGLGHPDYMADSIAEAFSRNLSRYYLNSVGKILHHNVDKLEIIGGKTRPEFGGGEVITPISILFSGRATDRFDGTTIPVREIALDSAKDWITDNLRYLNSNTIRYIFETKSGSENLSVLNKRVATLSNDSSFGVGYAPLSSTEQAVLRIEKLLNSVDFKKSHPYSGEDVKVLATRQHSKIDLIVADAFVDRFIPSIGDYFDRKAELYDVITGEMIRSLPEDFSFSLCINCMDDRTLEKAGCYLTVTGTSAEHGDDGSVGRSNRANGLITPNRAMSFEATAGKNPVNHIGKLYNILAFRIANEVHNQTGKEVVVKIAGKIGDPVDQPQITAISVWPRPNQSEASEIRRIGEEMIQGIPEITQELVRGTLSIF